MSEGKMTPGPWFAFPGDSVVRIVDGGLNGIAATNSKPYWKKHDAEDLANATAIAALPELIEALMMVRDADNDCKADGLPTIPWPARSKIDAALAKAGVTT